MDIDCKKEPLSICLFGPNLHCGTCVDILVYILYKELDRLHLDMILSEEYPLAVQMIAR